MGVLCFVFVWVIIIWILFAILIYIRKHNISPTSILILLLFSHLIKEVLQSVII